jgi:hypothetical protein
MKTIIGFPLAFIVATSITIFEAWVCSMLWLWLVTPIGLPRIHWPVFAGIGIIHGLFTFKPDLRERTDKEGVKYVTLKILAPCASLAAGWLIRLIAA